MIGLGRMGANMVRRLMKAGHRCVVLDVSPTPCRPRQGGRSRRGLARGLHQELAKPRHVWLMVPAAIAHRTLVELVPLLERDDVVIDGGNSYYHDDIRRAKELGPKGLHYVDVGTSGGVWGLERGYCLMIGGERETVQRLDPIFAALAPGRGDSEDAGRGQLGCTPTRTSTASVGASISQISTTASGRPMAAYAEGLNILPPQLGAASRDRAETTPCAILSPTSTTEPCDFTECGAAARHPSWLSI